MSTLRNIYICVNYKGKKHNQTEVLGRDIYHRWKPKKYLVNKTKFSKSLFVFCLYFLCILFLFLVI